MDQQRSQVFIAAFADPQEHAFVTAGVLAWHQSHPRGHVPAIFELLAVAHGGHHGRRRLGPDTAYPGNTLTIGACPEDTVYTSIEGFDASVDGRRRTQANELTKRAAEAESRLRRLYAAIESGVADLDDPSLKERIEELKATRDQARIDAECSKAAVENTGQIITATQLGKFANAARRRIGGSDGDYRRDHLRAFAQRVEVAEHEVRIMGSHNELLRLLTSSNGVESAANGVRTFVD